MTPADLYWIMYKRQAKLTRKYKRRDRNLNAECNRWATRYDSAWLDLEAARTEIEKLKAENADLALSTQSTREHSAKTTARARALREALVTAARAMDEFRCYLPNNSRAQQEINFHYQKACVAIGDPF